MCTNTISVSNKNSLHFFKIKIQVLDTVTIKDNRREAQKNNINFIYHFLSQLYLCFGLTEKSLFIPLF